MLVVPTGNKLVQTLFSTRRSSSDSTAALVLTDGSGDLTFKRAEHAAYKVKWACGLVATCCASVRSSYARRLICLLPLASFCAQLHFISVN